MLMSVFLKIVALTPLVPTLLGASPVPVIKDTVEMGKSVWVRVNDILHRTCALAPENTDIDECETDGDECDLNASCMNTPGSFTCACNQGYSGDGLTCNGKTRQQLNYKKITSSKNLDIDECVVGSHNCDPNARCTNTPGSFTCACNQGYSGDGFTCEGKV